METIVVGCVDTIVVGCVVVPVTLTVDAVQELAEDWRVCIDGNEAARKAYSRREASLRPAIVKLSLAEPCHGARLAPGPTPKKSNVPSSVETIVVGCVDTIVVGSVVVPVTLTVDADRHVSRFSSGMHQILVRRSNGA